jgi:hypothetical protein
MVIRVCEFNLKFALIHDIFFGYVKKKNPRIDTSGDRYKSWSRLDSTLKTGFHKIQ